MNGTEVGQRVTVQYMSYGERLKVGLRWPSKIVGRLSTSAPYSPSRWLSRDIFVNIMTADGC
jgi:hypothetical protein